ncbi:uncharacterized protein MELLADRAFT_103723 [Melampsora larici-populina 98AG31]|uniref:Uncharacterized protein n=1 Tax=Melampsora larici-populina (strain 98AG31 / pathotype 3-4-7) TaxID=747676 RepID=F4RC61_MELLP|nr:uncharacterized protein MELLADRAFT_103723 [Melampsora larici-populina 98AG31]EGG10005.1 hypothetical protein MELLADRAFT_103723 [Melampsora larici-populina 98AG31]
MSTMMRMNPWGEEYYDDDEVLINNPEDDPEDVSDYDGLESNEDLQDRNSNQNVAAPTGNLARGAVRLPRDSAEEENAQGVPLVGVKRDPKHGNQKSPFCHQESKNPSSQYTSPVL